MTGEVLDVFRWPGKGFGGERPRAIRIGPAGVEGDRVHVLMSGGKKLTALGVPRLLLWRARPDGVTGPDGRDWGWDDGDLPAALSEDLGRPVQIEEHPDGRPDVPGTVHVTFEASRAALETALAGDRVDVRRFRPNLHLATDTPAWAEEEWVGRRLRAGEAVLVGDHLCDRCAVTTRDPDTSAKRGEVLRWVNDNRATFFGVRFRVAEPGRVAPGDAVELLG